MWNEVGLTDSFILLNAFCNPNMHQKLKNGLNDENAERPRVKISMFYRKLLFGMTWFGFLKEILSRENGRV